MNVAIVLKNVYHYIVNALFSPPFGSNAAWSACYGAVYMRQIGVVSCVVLRTNLKKKQSSFKITCLRRFVPFYYVFQYSSRKQH